MERILLIIDDDKTDSDILNNMLKEGFYIKCSENLKNGLKKVNEIKPHVIVADLNTNRKELPFDQIRAFKNDFQTRVIPIIGISSNQEDERKAYINGCDYFLKKPIDNFKILETLHKMANKRLNILAVDDDDDILDIIDEFLNQTFNILRASDGEEALLVYQNNLVHMLITDIQMSKMDGVSLIHKIRENDSSLPILAISGVGASHLVNAMKVGSDNIVDKPFSDEDLKKVIRRVIINHYPYKSNW